MWTNSDNPSLNSLNDKEKRTRRSSVTKGVQSGLGLVPKRSWSLPDRDLQRDLGVLLRTRRQMRRVNGTMKRSGRERLVMVRIATQNTRRFFGHAPSM